MTIPFLTSVEAGYTAWRGTLYFESTATVAANPAYPTRMVIYEPHRVELGGPDLYEAGQTESRSFNGTVESSPVAQVHEMRVVSFYVDPHPTGGILVTSNPGRESTLTFTWC